MDYGIWGKSWTQKSLVWVTVSRKKSVNEVFSRVWNDSTSNSSRTYPSYPFSETYSARILHGTKLCTLEKGKWVSGSYHVRSIIICCISWWLLILSKTHVIMKWRRYAIWSNTGLIQGLGFLTSCKRLTVALFSGPSGTEDLPFAQSSGWKHGTSKVVRMTPSQISRRNFWVHKNYRNFFGILSEWRSRPYLKLKRFLTQFCVNVFWLELTARNADATGKVGWCNNWFSDQSCWTPMS